jgi:putative YphP/YqiW family bacilliredoxin
MYPAELVAPMRKELTDIGFTELLDPQSVDNVLENSEGTTFLMINSVCGCAAGAARPGVKKALASAEKKPNNLVTVFRWRGQRCCGAGSFLYSALSPVFSLYGSL